MKKNLNYWTRRSHRYLGLFIGIQFLMWTLGGLYFSWNDIDDVHGDHLRQPARYLATAKMDLQSPQFLIDYVKQEYQTDSIKSLRLIEVFGQPYYQLAYFMQHGDHAMAHFALGDAHSGEVRGALTKEEAVQMAEAEFLPKAGIKKVEYLTETSDHHEYRGRMLPVYSVTFDHPTNTTVYVDPQQARVSSIRHDQWRAFDFLWMLHTMDYEGRDDFGNVLLKAFSILGLVTITSGFMLFYFTSPTLRRKKKPRVVEAKVTA